MKTNSFIASAAVFAFAASCGCNFQDEKPRGAGASGRPLAVLAKAQIDMERFVKYTPEQDKVIELMHQPFEAVSKPGPAANSPEGKAVSEKVKKTWDEQKFIKKKEGRIIRYRVTLDTTKGDLVLDFFESHTPDVARNFITRASQKMLDGLHITLDGSSLIIGEPLEKQAYTLPARPIAVPMPKGTLYAFLVDGRASSSRFGITMRRISGGGKNVSIFGRVANANLEEVLGLFAAALSKQPDSIVVKSSRVQTFDSPVFEGAAVRLPTINKKGELEVPDIAMYTSVSNPEVDPRNAPLDPNAAAGLKTRKPLPESITNPMSDLDTIKSKNPNAPPIKKNEDAPSKSDKEPPRKP